MIASEPPFVPSMFGWIIVLIVLIVLIAMMARAVFGLILVSYCFPHRPG